MPGVLQLVWFWSSKSCLAQGLVHTCRASSPSPGFGRRRTPCGCAILAVYAPGPRGAGRGARIRIWALFSRFGLEATKVKPSSKTYLLTPSTGIRLFSRPATSLFFFHHGHRPNFITWKQRNYRSSTRFINEKNCCNSFITTPAEIDAEDLFCEEHPSQSLHKRAEPAKNRYYWRVKDYPFN
jgi:hypothetical protein